MCQSVDDIVCTYTHMKNTTDTLPIDPKNMNTCFVCWTERDEKEKERGRQKKKSHLSIINFMNNNNHSSSFCYCRELFDSKHFSNVHSAITIGWNRLLKNSTWNIQHSFGHNYDIQGYKIAFIGQERGKLLCLSA